jgi:membrane protein YqaA with SNARE-associated domain
MDADHPPEPVATLDAPPEPLPPGVPPWFWSVIVLLLSALSGIGWLLSQRHPLQWALVPFTMVGNSLAMVPYDWYLPAYVQVHEATAGIAVATLATVVIEFWNMDVLARLLSRQGTVSFRQHHITTRLLGWYRKAPWWTLTVAGCAPIIPFYPCRFLATLARYPLWRYQSAVVVGRSIRYAGLAGLGLILPIPPVTYFILGAVMLAYVATRYLAHRRREAT